MSQERSPEPSSLAQAFNKTVDQKIVDLNFKAAAFLGSLLYKPLAIASDPFFRKNMGERYFNGPSATLGMILWIAASGLTTMFSFGKRSWNGGLLSVWLHCHIKLKCRL